MANQGVNSGRRRFLTATTVVVGGAGAAMAAIPFLKTLRPSARAEVAGAPVTEDISKLEPGGRLMVQWRGQPVWIIRRTPEMLAALSSQEGRLRDPKSDNPDQTPPFAKNESRSIKPEILVLVGVCTHLGCVPLGQQGDFGGWFCPCHGSHYDTAGRIRKGPAPENLPVPVLEFLSDTKIKIG